MSIKCLVSILWLCSMGAMRSFAQPVIIPDAADQNIRIGQMISVLSDTSGKLTYPEVSSADFTNRFTLSNQRIPDFGTQQEPVWCRFSVKNRFGEKLVLVIENTELEWLDLYIP